MASLRLVKSCGETYDGPTSDQLGAPTARPEDRCERFETPDADLRALAHVTTQAGVVFDLGAALIAERQFLLADLAGLGLDRELDELDRLASLAHIDRALSPAHAAYLRSLRARRARPPTDRREPSSRAMTEIALPIRLAARMRDHPNPLGEFTPETLEQALTWEAAALLSGRTMSEWGLMVALGHLAAQTRVTDP